MKSQAAPDARRLARVLDSLNALMIVTALMVTSAAGAEPAGELAQRLAAVSC